MKSEAGDFLWEKSWEPSNYTKFRVPGPEESSRDREVAGCAPLSATLVEAGVRLGHATKLLEAAEILNDTLVTPDA